MIILKTERDLEQMRPAGAVAAAVLGEVSAFVKPGVTMREPRVNLRLPGCREALIACQAINIAITVVLPAPVASFSARRKS